MKPRVLTGLVVLAGILAPSLAAAASRPASTAVPTLAVENTCRQAEQRQGLRTYAACMADEAKARQQLAAGTWRSAKADTRRTCLANETVGDLASYIDLLTCVQLFEGVVLKPDDQN